MLGLDFLNSQAAFVAVSAFVAQVLIVIVNNISRYYFRKLKYSQNLVYQDSKHRKQLFENFLVHLSEYIESKNYSIMTFDISSAYKHSYLKFLSSTTGNLRDIAIMINSKVIAGDDLPDDVLEQLTNAMYSQLSVK